MIHPEIFYAPPAEPREGARPEFHFGPNAVDATKKLIGGTIQAGDQTVVITDAQGFLRAENEKGSYRLVLDPDRVPGEIIGTPHRGWTLPLVVTEDGGCIKLHKAARLQIKGSADVELKGPHAISQALGLTDNTVFILQPIDQKETAPTLQLIDPENRK